MAVNILSHVSYIPFRNTSKSRNQILFLSGLYLTIFGSYKHYKHFFIFIAPLHQRKKLDDRGNNKFERGSLRNMSCVFQQPYSSTMNVCVCSLFTNLVCIELSSNLLFIGMSTNLLLITIVFQKSLTLTIGY